MTDPERMIWAAAFAAVYNEYYPGLSHPDAVSHALKQAYLTVDAFRLAPDFVHMVNTKHAAATARIAAGDAPSRNRLECVEVEPKTLAMYNAFVSEGEI